MSLKYSTFRAFMDATPETIRDDSCDDIQYFDRILFKGSVSEAAFIAEYMRHLCLDKLGTDDYRMISILLHKNGMVEMQGVPHE